jgi:tetratricopeptide (TPR) repeat protein
LPVRLEEAEQQVRIWVRLAREAYGQRQVVRALGYFHRALDYAEQKGLDHEFALVCRDLGYVYGRERSPEKALACFERGLATSGTDVWIRSGLMANKASVLLRLGAYRRALALLDESSQLIRSSYPDFSGAPGQLVLSYAGIARMAEDLRKIVAFLDMGISPERLQVEIRRYEPGWLGGTGQ